MAASSVFLRTMEPVQHLMLSHVGSAATQCSLYLLTVTFVPRRGWVVRLARAESGEIHAHSARKSKSSREMAN